MSNHLCEVDRRECPALGAHPEWPPQRPAPQPDSGSSSVLMAAGRVSIWFTALELMLPKPLLLAQTQVLLRQTCLFSCGQASSLFFNITAFQVIIFYWHYQENLMPGSKTHHDELSTLPCLTSQYKMCPCVNQLSRMDSIWSGSLFVFQVRPRETCLGP